MTLSPQQLAQTVAGLAALQRPTGMIPWFPGGHCDPWNHVEAAMALSLGGRWAEAEAGYEWLRRRQNPDGSWFNYYDFAGEIEDYRLDTNCVAYVAVGVWQHFVCTADLGFLDRCWPMVDRAMGFILKLQQPRGEILWCIEPDLSYGHYALLTGSSSMYLSLRCAAAVAEALGHARPGWELAAGRLGHAIRRAPEAFEPKERWAMDWYYPVLCGVLTGDEGRARLLAGWDTFVLEGRGIRCVSDEPWVTAAETAECALALDAVGLPERADLLLGWAERHRCDDGMYWTGLVYPQEATFPGDERSSYTAAAVVLAHEARLGRHPAAALFKGAGLSPGLDLQEPARTTDSRVHEVRNPQAMYSRMEGRGGGL